MKKPNPASIPIRLINVIAKRKMIFKMWTSKTICLHDSTCHVTVRTCIGIGPEMDFHTHDNNHEPNIPAVCVHCGAVPNQEDKVNFHRSLEPHFDTESGIPEPGDVWYVDNPDFYKNFFWANDDGRHLHCCLPNGVHWDIDSRAGNCTMKDERTHRCWVRVGNPADGTLHISKDGHTCAAGAGSIQGGDYHGFLHHGYLNKC